MLLLGASFELWVLVITIVLLSGVWVQVSILHYRGAFNRIWMWEPVVLLPVVVIEGVIGVVLRGIALDVFGIFLAFVFLMGLTGTFFHVRGVVRRVGGWNLDNIMMGPPLLFPLSLALISLFGILAVVSWRF